jgi:ubiquinone/menaquinone biosynthesis C-methylase UbiE
MQPSKAALDLAGRRSLFQRRSRRAACQNRAPGPDSPRITTLQEDDATMSDASRYALMQKTLYENGAAASSYAQAEKVDYIVGSYDAHNRWPDYDRFLMRYVTDDHRDKLALDFACGPARNIIKYHHLFRRIDGADIAQNNLDNAVKNLKFHGIEIPDLYLTDGFGLGGAPDNSYDFIFSSIAMQHICVHEIRFKIFVDMYRCLKKLGRISIQMGFGRSPNRAGYYDNFYDAMSTNGGCDTMVEDPEYLELDLTRIGFVDFQYWIRPTGPGDTHPHWIFFTARK